MAGAGKSTVGRELANILNFRLIDSDTLIEEQQGKSLQKILDDEGYLRLREIENSVLKNLHFKEIILSTGGSAVYSDEAMKHIQQNSKVIFLDVSFNEILERVPNFHERGFAKAPSQSIEDAFEYAYTPGINVDGGTSTLKPVLGSCTSTQGQYVAA